MRDLSARKLETLGDVYKAIDNEEKEFSMDPLFWLKKRIVAIQDYDQHQHFCRELFLLGSSTPRVAEYFNFYNLEIIHAILHSGFQYEYKKFLKWFCRTGTIRELLFEFLYSSEDLLYKYEELQEPQFFQVAKVYVHLYLVCYKLLIHTSGQPREHLKLIGGDILAWTAKFRSYILAVPRHEQSESEVELKKMWCNWMDRIVELLAASQLLLSNFSGTKQNESENSVISHERAVLIGFILDFVPQMLCEDFQNCPTGFYSAKLTQFLGDLGLERSFLFSYNSILHDDSFAPVYFYSDLSYKGLNGMGISLLIKQLIVHNIVPYVYSRSYLFHVSLYAIRSLFQEEYTRDALILCEYIFHKRFLNASEFIQLNSEAAFTNNYNNTAYIEVLYFLLLNSSVCYRRNSPLLCFALQLLKPSSRLYSMTDLFNRAILTSPSAAALLLYLLKEEIREALYRENLQSPFLSAEVLKIFFILFYFLSKEKDYVKELEALLTHTSMLMQALNLLKFIILIDSHETTILCGGGKEIFIRLTLLLEKNLKKAQKLPFITSNNELKLALLLLSDLKTDIKLLLQLD